jgi:hypothetical protein
VTAKTVSFSSPGLVWGAEGDMLPEGVTERGQVTRRDASVGAARSFGQTATAASGKQQSSWLAPSSRPES